jgi:hypothetical protein
MKKRITCITPETKLLDLIQDGFEIDTIDTSYLKLTINIKKTERDFNGYISEYISGKVNDPNNIISYIIDSGEYNRNYNKINHNLRLGYYSDVPFEIKIGLLNFICKDRGLKIHDLFTIHGGVLFYKNDLGILPKNFINEITEQL